MQENETQYHFTFAHSKMQMRQKKCSHDSGEPISPRMRPKQMAHVSAPGTSLLLSELPESKSSPERKKNEQ